MLWVLKQLLWVLSDRKFYKTPTEPVIYILPRALICSVILEKMFKILTDDGRWRQIAKPLVYNMYKLIHEHSVYYS